MTVVFGLDRFPFQDFFNFALLSVVELEPESRLQTLYEISHLQLL